VNAPLMPRERFGGPSAGVFMLTAGLVLASAVGFYAPYFSRLPRFEGSGWQVHVHVLTVGAWLGMLCVQAWLGRANRYAAHRRLGRVSYLLVPLVILSFGLVADFGQRRQKQPDLLGAAFFDGSLFLACYLLAMISRRNRGYHSRYMMLTAVAMMNAPLGRAVSPEFSVTLQVVLILGLLVAARIRGTVWQPYAVAAAVYISLLAVVLTATVLYPQLMATLWMAFWG